MRSLSLVTCFMVMAMVVSAQSPHGKKLTIDCANCHVSTSWKIQKDKMAFNHGTTVFPLAGQHQTVDCKKCHSTLVFGDARTECYTCHKDMHKNSVGLDCQRCHTPQSWIVTNVIQLHQGTHFPLLGAHAQAECLSCHTDYGQFNFRVAGVTCYDCHASNYASTNNPNHAAAGFSRECQECHNVAATQWSQGTFSSHNFFPLEQGHKVSCISCHRRESFKGLSRECYSCHSQNYAATKVPDHKKLNFATQCSNCHTIAGWKPASFDHNTTGFPLLGAHKAVDCSSCHTNGTENTPKICSGCHMADINKPVNPNHKLSNFPKVCDQCHSVNGWKPTSFTHAATSFPLTGQHVTVTCNQCHTVQVAGTPKDCASCHNNDKNTSKTLNHNLANFPPTCEQCHSVNGWKPTSFSHATTNFPLTGQHLTVTCNQCHAVQIAGTPKDCASCHSNDKNTSKTLNHNLGGFPPSCEQCHTTSGWKPTTFNHATTSFPLTGMHSVATCNQCHTVQITGTPKDCYSCHANDNNVSTNPKHNLGNFPKTCDQCHTTNGWKPTSFNHAATNFPLTGKHQAVLCNNCHTSVYAGTSIVCKNCHQADITKPVNPVHTLGNFPQACEQCHNTSGWIPSTFNHASTNFQLVGKHLTVTCNSCHTAQYSGTPKDCYQCHQTDYNGAQNPNHKTGGYPTDCSMCHTSTAWIPSSFNHSTTGFTLTGKHATITCADCHGATVSHLDPTCSVCHKADIATSKTANHNLGNFLTGKTCDNCHTTTVWKPSTFNHSATAFPLTGIHATTSCNSCHVAVYSGTSKDCNSCHKNDYTSSANPPHASSALSSIFTTTCASCHNSSAWRPTTWSHTQYYNITVKHSTRLCKDCHTSWSNPAAPQCISCHQSDFNQKHSASQSKDCWKSGCHTNPSTFDK